jgi:hypothetical protein
LNAILEAFKKALPKSNLDVDPEARPNDQKNVKEGSGEEQLPELNRR